MIEDLRILFPGVAPNLCSAEFVQTLRQVRYAEAWVRYSFLMVGLFILVGLSMLILPDVLPRGYAKTLHLPGAKGHLTPSGIIVVAALAAFAIFFLYRNSRLRADIAPYSLDGDTLCRYSIRTARITGFGTWTSFGSRLNRFERILWNMNGVSGSTPYVKALFSAWLDYDDPVYIGVDPEGRNPPIFLGAVRQAPQVLIERPGDFRAVYLGLRELFQTSRRWKGKALVSFWGAEPGGNGQRPH